MFLIFLAAVIVVVWAYVLWIREWLVHKWPEEFSWWHSIEDWLWAKSRTILVARGYWIGGILIYIHDQLASYGFNVTPILDEISKFIPATYRPLALAVFLALTGLAFEWLRRNTDSAVGEKK